MARWRKTRPKELMRKVRMTPELSATLTPEYTPYPACDYCGTERKPPHYCQPMQAEYRQIPLGCLYVIEKHSATRPCTGTCAVNPYRGEERYSAYVQAR